jgi:hypothetical protein
LNDPQFVEAARRLGERVLQEFPADPAARNAAVFRMLIGRPPDAAEARIVARLFDEQRVLFAEHDDDAMRFIAVGESPWDEALPRADLAALTAVAVAIVNFDEFVVIR